MPRLETVVGTLATIPQKIVSAMSDPRTTRGSQSFGSTISIIWSRWSGDETRSRALLRKICRSRPNIALYRFQPPLQPIEAGACKRQIVQRVRLHFVVTIHLNTSVPQQPNGGAESARQEHGQSPIEPRCKVDVVV